MEVAICLIRQGDEFLLQRRVSFAHKGAAGLIGCFGGQIDEGEEPLTAICREIAEETSLLPAPASLETLGIVEVISDRDHAPLQVVAHAFSLEIDQGAKFEAREGEVVRLTKDEALANLSMLTPATRAVFEQLL